MSKSAKISLVLILCLAFFFAGVFYSDAIKDHAAWLFEGKQDDIELPDLSHDEGGDIGATVDESGEAMDNVNAESVKTQNNNVPVVESNQAVPINNEVKPVGTQPAE